MSFTVTWTKRAQKQAFKLETRDRQRVAAEINKLAGMVDPRAGAEKLVDWEGSEPTYRARAGDFRILFTVDDGASTMCVEAVKDRKEAYR